MSSIKFKILLIFSVLSLLFLSGCGAIFDDSKDNGNNCSSKALLILRVNKISSSTRDSDESSEDNSSNADQIVTENIQSLRVIMINAITNLIEINELISETDFNGGNSGNTIHTFIKEIEPGEKNCYLIANEESISNFTSEINTSSTLTDLLNAYQNNILAGAELITLLNSISFTSDFNIENGSILLPYASYYRLKLESGETFEEPLYLVPAATKYSVNITNKRKDKVLIKELYINSIADKNYLLPHVGKDNYYMNGTYWINWLENVSAESASNMPFDENQEFNTLWGWITDYELPYGAVHAPLNIMPEEGMEIDAQSNPEVGAEPHPGKLILPVFYKPESLNTASIGKESSSQSYSIKLTVQVDGTEEDVNLTRNLSNVKALFRNTYLIINIEFSEGYMHVYGEITPWTVLNPVNGYVTEESE